jgi:hypothetical protein
VSITWNECIYIVRPSIGMYHTTRSLRVGRYAFLKQHIIADCKGVNFALNLSLKNTIPLYFVGVIFFK